MIIKSLLDNDLYKFTMMQAVYHKYPNVEVEYKFVCRTEGFDFAPYFDKIQTEISYMSDKAFTDYELSWLSGLGYFKPDFIDHLSDYRTNTDCIELKLINNYIGTKGISLRIKGWWLDTILLEVPLLAIISEVCMNGTAGQIPIFAAKKLSMNLSLLNTVPLKFVDFGTRRRYSGQWQDAVIQQCKESGKLAGTSNLALARKYGVPPVGTMAHEWLQAHQALSPILGESQKDAMQVWVDEYRGELAIALTDVIGIDAFIEDFDLYFAKIYDGVRQDSGDPYVVAEEIIAKYKKLGIDPLTKKIIFSDGLDFSKMVSLYNWFKGQIQVGFGIGTKLTNDCGPPPLSIVIKMVNCNGKPVAKISDSPGKGMCEDEAFVERLKACYDVK